MKIDGPIDWQKLEIARIDAGLRKFQLARAAGLSGSTLTRIRQRAESGENESFQNVFLLARALSTVPENLMINTTARTGGGS